MILVFIAILGLAMGSFINAVVWRIREQSKSKKASQSLSILTGRSMCTHCKHKLAAKDLVPIFSWLYLRGKCCYCGKKIDDSPIVELLTSATFIVSYLFWPVSLTGPDWFLFGLWLASLVIVIALAIYDLRWMILPDRLILALTAVATIHVALNIKLNGGTPTAPILGAILLSGLFYLIFQVSRGQWIGGGDVKLAVALGLLAGSPSHALLVLFLASLIGTAIGLPLMVQYPKQGHQLRLPFGLLLTAALFVVYLFGQQLIDWYTANTLS